MIRRPSKTKAPGTPTTPAKQADTTDRGHICPWFYRAYARAVKAGRIRKNAYTPWNARSAFEGHVGCDRTIFDHMGSENGRLIGEPYASEDDPQLLEAIERFAAKFELQWEFTQSVWFPPHTVRVEFWPADPLLAKWRPFPRKRR